MNDPSLQEFWEACGGVRELRLLIEHPTQPARGVIVPTPFALLGSSDASEIFLPDDQISYRHAYLQFIAGQLWRFDLLSRTGTFWKQRRESAGLFDNSDAICAGSYRLQNLVRVHVQPAMANPLLAIPPDQDALPDLTLEFVNISAGPRSKAPPSWRMDRVLAYAGRSPLCSVRLNCSSVSYFHCSLLRTPIGAWVVDLLGRGGIAVNDAPVRWSRLRDGDLLKIGRFDIRIHETAPCALLGSIGISAGHGGNQHDDAPIAAPGPSTTLTSTELAAASRQAPLTALAGMTPLAWPGVVPLSPAIAPSTQLTNDAGQSLLLNVVNQFSIMQQQMLDQFQQTTFMMLQMFSAMQKDQFELIRQELDALRELNREIHELQAELAKHPAKPAGAPPSPEIAPSTKRRAGAASTNFAAQMPSPAVSAAPANQAGAANGARFVRKPVLVEPAAIDPAPKTNHVPKSTADAPATKEPASSGGPAAQGEDVHGWLSQRFNDLQKERQSRWQKIVGTLMGK